MFFATADCIVVKATPLEPGITADAVAGAAREVAASFGGDEATSAGATLLTTGVTPAFLLHVSRISSRRESPRPSPALRRPPSPESGCGIGLGLSLGDFGLGFGEETDGGADRGGLALSDDNGSEDAVVECLDVNVGLVGLNDNDAVAFGEDIALGLDQRDDFALRHSGAEGGHEDLPDLEIHQEGRTPSTGVLDHRREWEAAGGDGG
ncbi:unnamed protein product [Sphenostylis stenocarpa]|uniref:Uncharacterized protein n=1 Tax=Sphenostylis stenocarpa TaxID=92480 RepID=A0AA86VCR1_9FABA|nr:unnamed protein product [Sphenostylis stenocarpa]